MFCKHIISWTYLKNETTKKWMWTIKICQDLVSWTSGYFNYKYWALKFYIFFIVEFYFALKLKKWIYKLNMNFNHFVCHIHVCIMGGGKDVIEANSNYWGFFLICLAVFLLYVSLSWLWCKNYQIGF